MRRKAYDELFWEMMRLCDAVDHGELASGDAGRQLMKAVTTSPAVLPTMGLQDPSSRFVSKSRMSFLELARWLTREGPEELRYLVDTPRVTAALRAEEAARS